jgi:nucleoside-diphosphate-sugar epimerase
MRRAFVTGAGGFIGARLVERLALAGVPTRALLRRGVIAAAPVPGVEPVRGDVTDPAALRRGASGCDVLFHCAWGGATLDEARRVNVAGTRAAVEAAAAAGVQRVVHLSSMAVHGAPLPPVLDERVPLCTGGDAYAVSKAEGEREAFARGRALGVAVVALRPTLVYGPRAPLWVLGYFRRVCAEQVLLIDGGRGLANLVEVDDVIDAMLAAATADAAGEAFLVSGAAPVTWREYLGGFAALVGKPLPPSVPAWWARLHVRWMQRYGKLAERSVRLSDMDLRLMTQRTRVEIGKARASLGYAPRVDLGEGLRRCARWLRDAGYLPADARGRCGADQNR